MPRTSSPGSLLLVVFAMAAISAPAQSAPPAILHISLDKPALHAVSPTLYGLMTEEINYSFDGGLYAEMVRNRTMQDHDWAGLARWDVVHFGESAASFKLDPDEGPSVALPKSLRLTVTRADAAHPAGVRNEGFWGMAVRPSTTYTGSFYARADSSAVGPVSASLISNTTGATLATATTQQLTAEWKRYTYSLTTAAALEPSAENHLQLTVAHPGTVWITLVSLFPPTYKNRENGNRPDLMEMMAGMHPTFLREPGGNYLEGDTVEERFNWKTTIGPLVDRPTHRSPWNYQSSDGMGLLEFLEWTEDLKISPVLAVYAGYSLKGTHINAGPALEPFVQDALDELEFVTGDPSTPWGAKRASLGHPAPFPLHYVEIGNEDEFDTSGSYGGRYAQFYKAIKTKYPNLELIATTPIRTMKPDVLDDHFYKRADEFFDMTRKYDDADRKGPKVFVGEWATREGSPTTNLGAALGDAAWMTGMERNSDLIVLSAYAPMLVNVNPGGMQWESDLIGFDALHSYGSPGYYAQAMFAKYLGTEVPVTSLSGGGARFFNSVTRDASKTYVKLVNASSEPQAVQIQLESARPFAREISLVTLSGTNPAETNTLTAPTRITPVTSVIKGGGSTFSHIVPPYAIQVLVLSSR